MEGSEKVSQGSQSVSRKDGNEGGAKRTCFFLYYLSVHEIDPTYKSYP